MFLVFLVDFSYANLQHFRLGKKGVLIMGKVLIMSGHSTFMLILSLIDLDSKKPPL